MGYLAVCERRNSEGKKERTISFCLASPYVCLCCRFLKTPFGFRGFPTSLSFPIDLVRRARISDEPLARPASPAVRETSYAPRSFSFGTNVGTPPCDGGPQKLRRQNRRLCPRTVCGYAGVGRFARRLKYSYIVRETNHLSPPVLCSLCLAA